jgi:predicted transposase/invertase (TIGR01784 family)
MQHFIDPKVDCVFKALLGAEDNLELLLHFINSILFRDLPGAITEIELLNPYNEREFLGDKLTVVDVKARDASGRVYQIEIQLLVWPNLQARMMYGWADLYSSQLQEGQDYRQLRPCWSIWLVNQDVHPEPQAYAHRLQMQDQKGWKLLEHGGIWLLELGKFADVHREKSHVEGEDAAIRERTRWLRFFTEGNRLDADAPPEWMQTPEMKKAMETLRRFSEKEREYHRYQARMNYLREQSCIMAELEEARTQAALAGQEAERARAEREAAQAAAQAAVESAQAVAERERTERERERAEKEAAQAAAESAQAAVDRERAEKEAAQAELERLRRLLEQRREP